MPPKLATPDAPSLPLILLERGDVETWRAAQDAMTQTWVSACGFDGSIGQTAILPGTDGAPRAALAGYGTPAQRARKRYALAAALPGLPAEQAFHLDTGHLATGLTADALRREALGWMLAGYAFTRYAGKPLSRATLVTPEGVDATELEALAEAEFLTRDLINTPASDMGPDALEEAARDLASDFDARIVVTKGDDLLEANFPMIHTVGRAAARAPRLIDMRWGEAGPAITLVGKGVCFDTGGLNLKPGASMGLMKKDMGGAANTLGLARMIMALNLPLRLRVLIPAVENSVAGNSFRPGDILTARNGLTVEINNTDAEGRLVLADALSYADEDNPDKIISMATLTGAARVAVGPDLAPYYTTDSPFAAALDQAAPGAADPVWRMPFHDPYESMIEPGIADLDNAPSGGMAGSITAALFLRRFVQTCPSYTHFDIYCWSRSSTPGMAKGGLGQAGRAVLSALRKDLD